MSQKILDKLKTGDISVLPMVYQQCFTIDKSYKKPSFFKKFFHPNESSPLQDYAIEIANIMQPMDCKQLLKLRSQFSQSTSIEWFMDWNSISPKSIQQDVNSSDHYFYILALGTFHPNGYFREKCLDDLKAYGGKALPYTLLLINDWVEFIRKKAFDISCEIMREASSLEMIRSLAFIEQLRLCERRSKTHFEQLNSIVKEHLFDEGNITLSEIYLLDRYERRICYRIFPLDYLKANLNNLYKNEKDSFNRLQIVMRITETFFDQTTLALFMTDKFASIRIKTIESFVIDKENMQEIKQFLFDSSNRVREHVRFVFKKDATFNAAEEYRVQMQKQVTAGCILGLGETGNENDILQISPFLSYEYNTTIRKASLVATANIMNDKSREFLYEHLAYRWSSKSAFRIITARKYRFPCKRYYTDFLVTNEPAIQRRYFNLLIRGSAWDKLPWLIRLYPDLTPIQQHSVTMHLLYKYGNVFTAPSSHEQQDIFDALQEVQLPTMLTESVAFRSCIHKEKNDIIKG